MPRKSEESTTAVQWIAYLQPDQSERLNEDMEQEVLRLRDELGPEYDRTKSKHVAYVVNWYLKWVDAGKPDWDVQDRKLKDARKEIRELRKKLRGARK